MLDQYKTVLPGFLGIAIILSICWAAWQSDDVSDQINTVPLTTDSTDSTPGPPAPPNMNEAVIKRYDAILTEWVANGHITQGQYFEAIRLLQQSAASLSGQQARTLSVYLDLLNDRLTFEQLKSTLEAAKTPIQDWTQKVDNLNVREGVTLKVKSSREDLDKVKSPEKPLGNYVNSLQMRFVVIPSGEYIIGSSPGDTGHNQDETRHRARLSRAYAIGMTEITVREFMAFVKDTDYVTTAEKRGWADIWGELEERWIRPKNSSWRKPGFKQNGNHPVVAISYEDAIAFCQWLSRVEGINYRLPTETEWEIAARAGATTAYAWGDELEAGEGFANIADRRAKLRFPLWTTVKFNDGFLYTNQVASYKPNAWGLYDMHGNVWEWCLDYKADYPEQLQIDPLGPNEGERRVVRGGSWYSLPNLIRLPSRYSQRPDYASSDQGFRVVADLPSTMIQEIRQTGEYNVFMKKNQDVSEMIKEREASIQENTENQNKENENE